MRSSLGTGIPVDIKRLIDTRMLIQANSGGGKSYAIRKLLEVTHGRVQQIVLDIEGDFSSLRTHYDFILAGKGGDIVADPRSAEMLALKVLELRSDVIVDLYELKQHERIRFVKLFLESMINAPKSLWHPVMVIIDEAHIFCPEAGKSEAASAVIDICTRGRKRGFCPVLATQRISKLHKDAAAECNNKLIGRTGLDIDVKRAADELGLPVNAETKLLLRNLDPGEFFVFGPAISVDVSRGKVGPTKTKHARAGSKGMAHKPAPSAKVKAALKGLADLATQAEVDFNDKKEMTARIRDLESQLSKATKTVKLDEKQIERIKEDLRREYDRKIYDWGFSLGKEISDVMAKFRHEKMPKISGDSISKGMLEISKAAMPAPQYLKEKPDFHARMVKRMTEKSKDETLGACERKILGFLATRPSEPFTKVQVGAMTGYAHSSGGFNNALSKLTSMGFIVRSNGSIQLAEGADVAEYIQAVPHKLSDWVAKLGACERKVYELVLSEPSSMFTKDEVAERTQYAPGSGGFNNALSRLNTLGLIKREHGLIQLNPEINI